MNAPGGLGDTFHRTGFGTSSPADVMLLSRTSFVAGRPSSSTAAWKRAAKGRSIAPLPALLLLSNLLVMTCAAPTLQASGPLPVSRSGIGTDATSPKVTTGGKAGRDRTGRVLFIVAADKFRDEEFKYPYMLLRKAGYSADIASTTTGPARGMLGTVIRPGLLINAIGNPCERYDAVIFVGGSGAKQYFDDERAYAIARSTLAGGRVLAAICIAPMILARAGLLRNRRATCWPGLRPRLARMGVEVLNAKVVVDGRLVTGSGPNAAKLFGRRLVEILGPARR